MMKAIWDWLTSSNWKTWLGHALVGFTMAFLVQWAAGPSEAFWAVAIAFLYRELSDFERHGRLDPPPGLGFKGFLLFGWNSFRDDGYFDLVTPFIGYGVAMIVTGHASGEYAALSVVTLVVGLVLVVFGHRFLKKRWPWAGLD